MSKPLTTLLGGKNITITLDRDPSAPDQPPRSESILVRQIPLRDYPEGLRLYRDEISLVALLLGKPVEFVLGTEKSPGLSPESYEEVLRVGREVNEKHFFAFCRRHIEAAQHEAAQLEIARAEAVLQLPEEKQAAIRAQGMKALSGA